MQQSTEKELTKREEAKSEETKIPSNSKSIALSRTTTFLVMSELGASIDFYKKRKFDGEVSREKDLYKDTEGTFKILNSPQDWETAKKLLGEKFEEATIAFGCRYLYISKKQAEAVKHKHVEQIIYIGCGKNPRPIQKKNGKYENVNYFMVDQSSVIKSVQEIWEKYPQINNPRITYIGIDDFDTDDIIEPIYKKVDPKKKTLWIIEGVLLYFKPSTVTKIFDSIPQIIEAESIAIFDYQKHLKPVGDSTITSANQALENIRKSGAPAYNIYSDFEQEALKQCKSKNVFTVSEKTSLPQVIVNFGLGEKAKIKDARESLNFMEVSINKK